jgi:hypothetical protein
MAMKMSAIPCRSAGFHGIPGRIFLKIPDHRNFGLATVRPSLNTSAPNYG